MSLALGMAVTFAIAWAVALRTVSTLHIVDISSEGWALPVPEDWPTPPNLRSEFAFPGGRLLARSWNHNMFEWGPRVQSYEQRVVAMGWPWPSLCCQHLSAGHHEWRDPLEPPLGWQSVMLVERDALSAGTTPGPGLPLRPYWPGFAYSLVFYGAIAWLVMFGPGALVRRGRRRRGACVRCGYQRAVRSARCAECGRAPS